MMTLLLAAAVLQETDRVDEITTCYTQGKPHDPFVSGKPDREFVVRRDKDGFAYVIRMNAFWTGVKKYTERTGSLTADEFKALEKLVRDHKLLDWKAVEGPVAACWGSAGIAVRGAREMSQSWTSPLKNGDGVEALTKAMSELIEAKLKARDAIAEVRSYYSIGEPMRTFEAGKPHETVTARRTAKGFEVVVAVNVPRTGVDRYTERKAEITAGEWEALTAVVESGRLAEWKAPERKPAPDWGEAGFAVKSAGGDHAQRWLAPIEASSAPEKLRAALASLAGAKLKELPLEILK